MAKTLTIDLDKALRLQNVVQSGDFYIKSSTKYVQNIFRAQRSSENIPSELKGVLKFSFLTTSQRSEAKLGCSS
jgi:hypothetical protein